MKRVLATLFGLSTVVFLVSQPRAQQTNEIQPNRVGTFMHAKLDHAQKVLEGLALEDYDLIAKHSQAMSLLSLESSWQVLQTSSYIQHSNDFRQVTGALTHAAKEKNLDGATLAYVEICMKCVNCHKYVRKERKRTGESEPAEPTKKD